METTSNPATTSNITRPWQGTLLGVLNIIWLALWWLTIIFLLLLVTIFRNSAITNEVYMDTIQWISSTGLNIFWGIAFLIIAILIALFTLGVFITIGFFKGRRWTIIVAIIFSGLSIISEIIDQNFFSLIFSGLILWAEIICFQHSFYNQGNITTSQHNPN